MVLDVMGYTKYEHLIFFLVVFFKQKHGGGSFNTDSERRCGFR